MMNQKVLEISNLRIGYKRALSLQPISLSAYRKDLICLIGRNGTGKTTLLNTLSGVIKPMGGDFNICGQPVSSIPARKKSLYVSFVPSKIDAVANMTLRNLIAIGRTPYTNIFDHQQAKDQQLIEQVIAKFSLEALADRALSDVSDGEKQKAMIARSIVQQTPLILLDEPTAFLDFFAKQQLLQELKQIANTENRCILFSCHDVEMAVEVCDKIWLIDQGKLQELSKNQFNEMNYLKTDDHKK
ncbi:MAG: ABC transporter ATP-binding protein [Bacteroidales bacterium]|jgi:iron complex transport system ATP-binding protein|nr:ABC transporter ATP-binding protein [Bacteroidales bacterium]MBQ4477506.1 ABC transporter ATP-binding protein [Bacteroidales bacterium]MCR5555720.1 ABC transporter ATP-binding protein [Bacteroidales bacterium]